MPSRPHCLLINPAVGEEIAPKPVISLGYIAAYLRQHDIAAEIIDLDYRMTSPRSLQAAVAERAPILIGISAYQDAMAEVVDLAQQLRHWSECKIILGGPQAVAMPDEGLLALEDVDLLCRGEGELVCLALMRALAAGEPLETVPGISFKDESGRVVTTASPTIPKDLDVYPSPYLEGVLPIDLRKQTMLVTSRGCPHHCAFCLSPLQFGRRVRVHSLDRVMAELTYAHQQGARNFSFGDACLTVSKRRTLEFFQRIVDSGLEATFVCETRAEAVDDELLPLMRRAGVKRIQLGLESADQDHLDTMNKNQDIGAFTTAVHKIIQAGIEPELMFLLRAPWDTFASSIKTIDYVRSLGLYLEGGSLGSPFQIYFGSDVCLHPDKYGVKLPEPADDDRRPAFLSPGVHFETDRMSDRDYQRLRERVMGEWELARLRRSADMARDAFGLELSPLQAFALPWTPLESARRIVKREGSLAWQAPGPYDHAVVVADGQSAAAPIADTVRSLLPDLTYGFSLVLIGGDQTLLLEAGVVDGLVDLLGPSKLHDPYVAFSVSPASWRGHKAEILQALARFNVTRPRQFGREHPFRLGKVSVLLDLSAQARVLPSVAFSQATAMTRALAPHTESVLLYYAFDEPASVDRFAHLMRGGPWSRSPVGRVAVGLCGNETAARLDQLYREADPAGPLPWLLPLGRSMLVPGRGGDPTSQAPEAGPSSKRRSALGMGHPAFQDLAAPGGDAP